ncbi:MAG: PAS domain S-box protein [Nitrospinae bacterium]|nr:PAS domain S-box protein [Nitrospinota bacterium]
MAQTLLFFSILLQIITVALSLRLIKQTGAKLAWLLFSAGFILMALRRLLTYSHAVRGDIPIDLDVEVIALFISALFAAGIFLIGPLFESIRRTRDSLFESNELLERIFDTTFIMVAYMDKDCNFIRVNRAYAASDGRTPDFYPGKNHFALFPNPDNERIFKKVAETGETHVAIAKPFEYAEHPERGMSYWDWVLHPLKDPKGNVEALLLILSNVTDRINALLEVRESERQYRILARSYPNGTVHIVDSHLRLVISEGQALKELGFETEEMEGKTIREVLPPETADILEPKFKTAFAGEAQHGEISFRGFDFIYSIQPLADRDGKVASCIAVTQDITSIKEAQKDHARLSTAIEQGEDLVVITDRNGKIVYVNPAFERTTGWLRAEAVGQNPRILKSGKHPEQLYADMWNTIAGGKRWRGQLVNKKKNGDLFEVETKISPILGDNGEITSFVAVQSDITQTQSLTRAKDYFTTITAHELRTPLTRLNLIKMQMEKMKAPPEYKQEFNDAVSQLSYCVADFDRICSATTIFSDVLLGKGKEYFLPQNLKLLLEYCIEMTKEKIIIEKRKLALTTDLSALPETARALGDHAVLQRAIIEILSNAAKFSPDGKAIRIAAAVEGPNAVILIADEGMGIAPEQMGLLFTPFFSLEDPIKHSTGQYKFKGGGLGIGLALAKAIMDYHGGTLELSSAGVGKGTTAIISLPLI